MRIRTTTFAKVALLALAPTLLLAGCATAGGKDGKDGRNGATGPQGADGQTGDTGRTGADGHSPTVIIK